jgi:hypothetical protein
MVDTLKKISTYYRADGKRWEKKQVSCVQAVVGLSANFHVSIFTTRRKIIKKA